MNLKPAHALNLLGAAIVGGAVGYALSLLAPSVVLQSIEKVIGRNSTWMLFGSLAGIAITILTLIIKDSRDAGTGPAANFSMINGTGSMFIGRDEPRPDGSYVTTEWFCMLFIPVFPVCNYRLTRCDEQSNLVAQTYHILEKHPVRLTDLPRGYVRTLAAAMLVATVVCYLSSFK
jgi:hypothetical protein